MFMLSLSFKLLLAALLAWAFLANNICFMVGEGLYSPSGRGRGVGKATWSSLLLHPFLKYYNII